MAAFLFLMVMWVGVGRAYSGGLFVKRVKNLDFVQPSDLGVLL